MAHSYQAVTWTRQKRIYDLSLLSGVVLFMAVFFVVGLIFHPAITAETLMIRSMAGASFALLHVILSIGPLCRLNDRFLPLLYNRRHLGVTMFILAFGHGFLSIFQFHALGNVNPLVSLFTSNGAYGSLSAFPFQPLGFFALIILFLMAATSHDFWLVNLTPLVWKALHMLVYIAYGLIVLHVAFGVLQSETSPVYTILVGAGFLWIVGLHLVAGFKEKPKDQKQALSQTSEFVEVCSVDEIPEKRAFIATLSGERVAVFKYDGKISAVSNVCRHQNGPLGEGQIIDGLITCPWHGYQYKPDCGKSPEPFTEQVTTFNVKIQNGRVLVDPKPNPAGTQVEPAKVTDKL